MRDRGLRSRVPYLVFDAFVNSYDTVALAAIFGVLGASGGIAIVDRRRHGFRCDLSGLPDRQ